METEVPGSCDGVRRSAQLQHEEGQWPPGLSAEMLTRAKVRKGGRPVSDNPRKLIAMRLPADALARWKSTGPGWQTRMAKRLSKVAEET